MNQLIATGRVIRGRVYWKGGVMLERAKDQELRAKRNLEGAFDTLGRCLDKKAELERQAMIEWCHEHLPEATGDYAQAIRDILKSMGEQP